MRLGGQVRVVAGLSSARFLGWDLSAAFALSDALGIDRLAVAELLPAIEQVAMSKINEQVAADAS